jgi:hypothetical protein
MLLVACLCAAFNLVDGPGLVIGDEVLPLLEAEPVPPLLPPPPLSTTMYWLNNALLPPPMLLYSC